MSYANDNCQDSFSVEQKAAMRSTVTIVNGQAGPRLYLTSPPIASYDTILDSKPIHLHPANNSVNNVPNLTFRWNRVPGATMYLLRISRLFTFSGTLIEDRIVYDTSYQYTGNALNPNVDYYWSLKAINHKVTCGNYSASSAGNYWKFRTIGVAGVTTPTTTDVYTLYPNPSDGETAWIHLEPSFADGQSTLLEFLDATGRLTHQQVLEGSGTHAMQWSNSRISPGLYQIRLQNKVFGLRTGRWLVQ
jgi:hypothetical protein